MKIKFIAARTPPGKLPSSQPLQPAPQFVKPNYEGSVNFNAEKAAQPDDINFTGDNQSQAGQTEQIETTVQDQAALQAKANLISKQSAIFIAAIICAIILLAAAWIWYLKRWMKHNRMP